jgi:hypothetical protein
MATKYSLRTAPKLVSPKPWSAPGSLPDACQTTAMARTPPLYANMRAVEIHPPTGEHTVSADGDVKDGIRLAFSHHAQLRRHRRFQGARHHDVTSGRRMSLSVKGPLARTQTPRTECRKLASGASCLYRLSGSKVLQRSSRHIRPGWWLGPADDPKDSSETSPRSGKTANVRR